MSQKIFVGNLPFETNEEALREAFAPFGEVDEVKCVMDRDTGRFRGFAFVTMAAPDQAARAIEELDGTTIGGRSIRVNLAEDRRDAPRPRGFGGGGGGGGGGNRGGRDGRSGGRGRW